MNPYLAWGSKAIKALPLRQKTRSLQAHNSNKGTNGLINLRNTSKTRTSRLTTDKEQTERKVQLSINHNDYKSNTVDRLICLMVPANQVKHQVDVIPI